MATHSPHNLTLGADDVLPYHCKVGSLKHSFDVDSSAEAPLLSQFRDPSMHPYNPHTCAEVESATMNKYYLVKEASILLSQYYSQALGGYSLSDTSLFHIQQSNEEFFFPIGHPAAYFPAIRLYTNLRETQYLLLPKYNSDARKDKRRINIGHIATYIRKFCSHGTATIPCGDMPWNTPINSWAHFRSHWLVRKAILIHSRQIRDAFGNTLHVSLHQVLSHLEKLSTEDTTLVHLQTVYGDRAAATEFSLLAHHPLLALEEANGVFTPVSNTESLYYNSFTANTNNKRAANRRPIYWDNGSSIHVTPDIKSLANVTTITPFPLGGVGSSIIVTAVGKHMGLPPGLDKCYYAAKASATLFSIGYLCSLNCSTTQNKMSLQIYDQQNVLITTSLPLSNHLSPVDELFLINNRAQNYHVVKSLNATTLQPTHFTPEVLSRMTEVENLHHALHHPGDTTLGEALDTGAIRTPLNCTSIDVRNNRQARLACPQCSEGKETAPSYSESTAEV
jgi:hypothetical protein